MRNTRNVKQLIINADDFGWDIDSCKATIDCMETGSVTSATIMTGRPATDMACEYAAENAHRFSFGLHFNIVDQHKPLAKNPASLIDHGSHAFRDSDQQRKLALLGGLKAEDLQNELMAQIEELKQKKVKISHIDSHGHMHKFPCIISALKPTLLQNNIHRVRRPQNLYGQGSKMSTKIINAASTPFFKSLTSTNYLLTVSSYESNWFNRLLAMLPNGTTELAVHPAYQEKWRHEEARPLLDNNFSRLIADHCIQLTNFHNIS